MKKLVAALFVIFIAPFVIMLIGAIVAMLGIAWWVCVTEIITITQAIWAYLF